MRAIIHVEKLCSSKDRIIYFVHNQPSINNNNLKLFYYLPKIVTKILTLVKIHRNFIRNTLISVFQELFNIYTTYIPLWFAIKYLTHTNKYLHVIEDLSSVKN